MFKLAYKKSYFLAQNIFRSRKNGYFFYVKYFFAFLHVKTIRFALYHVCSNRKLKKRCRKFSSEKFVQSF